MARKFLNLKTNRKQRNVRKAVMNMTNHDKAKVSNRVVSFDFTEPMNSQYLALL